MPGTPQTEDMGGLHTLFENGIEIPDNIISPNDVKHSETTHHEPSDEGKIPEVQQKGPKWQECFSCKEGGYDKKTCKRCGLISYCNKDCQLQDYQTHKHPCRRMGRFNTAKSKTDPLLMKNGRFFDIAYFLGSIPDITRYKILGGPRVIVMLEIVENVEDPVMWKAKVRDIENKTTVIVFDTFLRGGYLDITAYYKDSCFLARVLKPGNFILLLNSFWRFYQPKAAELVVEDMCSVQFFEMSN